MRPEVRPCRPAPIRTPTPAFSARGRFRIGIKSAQTALERKKKSLIAPEALREQATVADLERRYQVHANQVSTRTWQSRRPPHRGLLLAEDQDSGQSLDAVI